MELKAKIKETKARKKGFLKAMPEEQRRLLKMQERANAHARRLLYGIPILFVVLLAGYFALCLTVPYERSWIVNGILAALIFVLGTILLLVLRSSYRKKSKALSSSITDYIQEYDALNQKILDLKEAARIQAAAERKAARAKEKARAASERAAEQVRKAEERAKASQEEARAASDHAAKISAAPVQPVSVPTEPLPAPAVPVESEPTHAVPIVLPEPEDSVETAPSALNESEAAPSSVEEAEPETDAAEAAPAEPAVDTEPAADTEPIKSET
ncbi:MAG: hypothetical protein Q4A88_06435 [Clostridia bacterium]|nr:hypothetical protein [Clostridia bacterium]